MARGPRDTQGMQDLGTSSAGHLQAMWTWRLRAWHSLSSPQLEILWPFAPTFLYRPPLSQPPLQPPRVSYYFPQPHDLMGLHGPPLAPTVSFLNLHVPPPPPRTPTDPLRGPLSLRPSFPTTNGQRWTSRCPFWGRGRRRGGLTPTQRSGTPFPFSLHFRPLLPDVPTRSVCDANL